MDIKELIEAEDDRRELFNISPQQLEARSYYPPENPVYTSMASRAKDLQLLDMQAHGSYPTAAARSRTSVASILKLGLLTARTTAARVIEAAGPVQFTPAGYESTWMSDVKLAQGYFNVPYNVRPGMAMAIGQQSLQRRVSGILPTIGTMGIDIAAWQTGWLAGGAAGGALAGGPAGLIGGVAGGLGASMLMDKFLNPALRANIGSFQNWFDDVGWRIQPTGPTITGVGLTPQQRGKMAYSMADIPYARPGVTIGMVGGAAQQLLQTGWRGGTDDFTRVVSELSGAIRDMSRNLNLNVQGSQAVTAALSQAGISYGQMGPLSQVISSSARTAGVSYQQMISAGVMGGQFARAYRMGGATGVSAGMQSLWMAESLARGGRLGAEAMAQMGGVPGIQQALTYETTGGFLRAPGMVRLIGAAYQPGGALNEQVLDRYVTGSITSDEINKLYRKNVMENKTKQYEFYENLPKVVGTVDPMVRLQMSSVAYSNKAKALGIDINNTAAMTAYLRASGVHAPEAMLAISEIGAPAMRGAILSDIQHQQRLDLMAEARAGRHPYAPFREMGKFLRSRGRSYYHWSVTQKSRFEQRMETTRMEGMGIYNIDAGAMYGKGSEDYLRQYWQEIPTEEPLYTTPTIDASQLGPTMTRPLGPAEVYITSGRGGDWGTKLMSPLLGAYLDVRATGGVGGYGEVWKRSGEIAYQPLIGKEREMYPEGWQDVAREMASVSQTGASTWEAAAGLPEEVMGDIAKLAKIGRAGMIKDTGTLILSKAFGGFWGPTANLASKIYHDSWQQTTHGIQTEIIKTRDSIAKNRYGVNSFSELSSNTKSVINREIQSMFGDDRLKRLTTGDNRMNVVSLQDARQRRDAAVEHWKGDLKGKAKTGNAKKFLDHMIRTEDISKIARYSAVMRDANKNSTQYRRAEAALYNELTDIESGYEGPKFSQADVMNSLLTSGDAPKMKEMLAMDLHANQLEVFAKAQNYVKTSLLRKYAEDEEDAFTYKTLREFSVSKKPTEWLMNFATEERYKELEHGPGADPFENKLYHGAKALHQLDVEGENLLKDDAKQARQLFEELKKAGFKIPTEMLKLEGKPREEVTTTIEQMRAAIYGGIIGREMGGFAAGPTAVVGPTTIGELQNLKNITEATKNLEQSTKILFDAVKKVYHP